MTIYGIDVHPENQPRINFKAAADGGYKFAFVKTTESNYYVPEGLGDYFSRMSDQIEVPGFYHFLTGDSPGIKQADYFINRVRKLGGSKDRLLAVDFEISGAGNPTDAHLRGFISRVHDLTGGHPVIVYSMNSFWRGLLAGTSPSAPFKWFNAESAWEATVWEEREHWDLPARFYENQWLPWYEKKKPVDKGLGGREADFLQFTWGGLAGGVYCDVDAFRGNMEDLKKLT